MKKKSFIAIILAVAMLFSGFSATAGVSDARRTVDGYIEMITRFFRSEFGIRNYSNYNELALIPETENGYVPQGYCYSEDLDLHFISYYHDEKASVISIVDGKSGNKVKTLSLKKSNGKDFTGHAGGIAEDGRFLYIVDGKKIYRLAMAAVLIIPDGGDLYLLEKADTDVKCSYLNSDGEYLYAGEFYTYTDKGSYDTDESHHMKISLFETTYARCNAYKISELEFSVDSDEIATPAMIFTTPNCVQGFARMNDGAFVLSISYGRNNNSALRYFEDVTKAEADFSVNYGETEVPAYHLSNSRKTVNLRQPPLLEGIDDMNGKVSGIFESCADKYSDAAVIIEKICVFE